MIMQPFKREFEGRNIPPSIKKHIFDKKTYEFQIYVNEKETILIHGLKKKQIKNKITYQFIENKIVIKFH